MLSRIRWTNVAAAVVALALLVAVVAWPALGPEPVKLPAAGPPAAAVSPAPSASAFPTPSAAGTEGREHWNRPRVRARTHARRRPRAKPRPRPRSVLAASDEKDAYRAPYSSAAAPAPVVAAAPPAAPKPEFGGFER